MANSYGVIMTIEKNSFGELVFTVGRFVKIKQIVGGEMIHKERLDDTFYYFGYE